MLSERQQQFLKSLYEMREDMIGDIKHTENELINKKVRLKQISSAITILEADYKTI